MHEATASRSHARGIHPPWEPAARFERTIDDAAPESKLEDIVPHPDAVPLDEFNA